MYLKSLKLKGFKSFADRVQLELERGLTVIVGPNGSGKSNVSDAILWVLGEQSAKQLRGAAMEDVVFAGSSSRNPVNVAEVDLVLDNSDHVLPVDFEEVAITRRMYRSGESEYLINGAPARLLDITDILHDTGLGKDTHSIISQGKLDQILMSRPQERRSLIEEAAGISKHKRRREKAVKRLASMDENLNRALDLQRELTRRLRPLERQVDRTQRYNNISQRITELRVALAVDDLRQLQVQWNAAEAQEKEARAQLELAEYQSKERSKELDNLQVMLEERGIYVGDLLEQRRRAQSLAERFDAAKRVLEEKQRSMNARRTTLQTSIDSSQRRLKDIREERIDSQAKLDEGEGEILALTSQMQEASQQLQEARTKRKSAEDALREANANAKEAQRIFNANTVALTKARAEADNARVQRELYKTRIENARDSLAQAKLDREKALTKQNDSTHAKEAAEKTLAEASTGVSQARSLYEEKQRAYDDARTLCLKTKARLDGLISMRGAETGTASAVQKTEKYLNNEQIPYKRLSQVISAPPELEAVTEVLLGEALNGFAVEQGQTFEQVLQQIVSTYKTGSGKVCISGYSDNALSRDNKGQQDRLIDLLHIEEGYEEVFEGILGNVVVADSWESALSQAQNNSGTRFITRDGLVVMEGATADVGIAQGVHTGVLERERTIKELNSELEKEAKSEEDLKQELDKVQAELEAAREAYEDASKQNALVQGEFKAAVAEYERNCALVTRLEREHDQIQAQYDALLQHTEDYAAKAEQAQTELDAAKERLDASNDAAAEAQEAFENARREDGIAHGRHNECQVALARVQERTKSLRNRFERLQKDEASCVEEDTKNKKAFDELTAKCCRIAPLEQRLNELEDLAKEYLAQLKDKTRLAEADSAALKQAIEAAKLSANQASQAYTEALTLNTDIKVKKGRLDERIQETVRQITSQRGVILEEALMLPELEDRAQDEAELSELEEQLETIGPVNQVAMEEYTELKERSAYIDEQVADLKHARTDLNKIIAAIDKRMRASFYETFDQVNKNFIDVFSMLFPGGNGHLELIDGEDPDTCGIEVIAQPQGKRVTKMSLLSGGERSLTALGLLFAVYRTRTVPFYVLDEVEAALDDSNLDRLLAAIDILREKTQLIVISHQRRTMERADVLYGVSMQADGVSRVVSQRLDRHGNVVDI